ncbi:hypothetical protein TNCV_3711821 [Trichonephila clavipes]|uniref:Uncharacterized protein n=1 Tax=Trichonephila clavipes TaxID=2585209 RepID=A0A8X6R7W5_TRICX|nr:hypothetical protein TNCV_3711821 [Trichonephila clavipes]
MNAFVVNDLKVNKNTIVDWYMFCREVCMTRKSKNHIRIGIISESEEVHQTTSLDEDHDRNLSSLLFINPFTSRLFHLASPLLINPFTSRLFHLTSLLRSVLILVLVPYRCHLATAAFHNRHR